VQCRSDPLHYVSHSQNISHSQYSTLHSMQACKRRTRLAHHVCVVRKWPEQARAVTKPSTSMCKTNALITQSIQPQQSICWMDRFLPRPLLPPAATVDPDAPALKVGFACRLLDLLLPEQCVCVVCVSVCVSVCECVSVCV